MQKSVYTHRWALTMTGLFSGMLALFAATSDAHAQSLPPHDKVLEGYEKVVSTIDGSKSMYTLYLKKKENQLLAELPKNYASEKYFIALTIASGNPYAGLQQGDIYVYWRRYNNRLALIAPQLEMRGGDDAGVKSSVNRLFTGRVLLDTPIVTTGPGGGPVIDLDSMLITKAPVFFGGSAFNKSMLSLYKLTKVKAFPDNIEIAIELPNASRQLHTLHYSISTIPANTGYKPRKADERIGYFTTSYTDLSKYDDDETRTRFINRWHLEKADPKLKLSPPKKAIEFYIEHTTPVRYRRWVREGMLSWNKAFEKIGIVDAIEVYYQDAKTGAHMEKDPEDVRYNFVRWLNNDVGTAIGPSRVDPNTGQILDADIILTDGWIRHYKFQFEDVLPRVAMEGFGPQQLSWLAQNPQWDPRIRLAHPAQRAYMQEKISRDAYKPYGNHPFMRPKTKLIGDDPFDGLAGRVSQVNGMCLAAQGKAFDVALMRMSMEMMKLDAAAAEKAKADKKKDEEEKDGDKEDDKDKDDEEEEEKEKKEEKKENLIDGMPEEFVGPLLAHLVAHEAGHTLGLRHNFKASSIYELEKINSEELKGKKPLAGSVMDYMSVNINVEGGKVQGDWTMQGVGPYDMWAIEYGYTSASDLEPILKRSAEPELVYGTDEDAYGPDPLVRRYDFSKNPLDYAKDQVRLSQYHRKRLLKDYVKDGESFSRIRRGYGLTLVMQTRAVGIMANWLGGVHVSRNKKGDKDAEAPLQVVDMKQQRDALDFVIQNTFRDDAYGLTPELLSYMTVDKWSGDRSSNQESTWAVHDRVMGVQASALTMLLNPTTLERVYDNEYRTPAGEDALTLPEIISKLSDEIFSELDQKAGGKFTPRKPMVSSLRRNLQSEMVKRLIDLMMPGRVSGAAQKPVATLARAELIKLSGKMQQAMKRGNLDAYTAAHLAQSVDLIKKSLSAEYIYNANDIGGSSRPTIFFGQPEEAKE